MKQKTAPVSVRLDADMLIRARRVSRELGLNGVSSLIELSLAVQLPKYEKACETAVNFNRGNFSRLETEAGGAE
ncbi:MAG: hypothetical protein R6V03_01240 [Kiritimatiellia bacterium]